MPGTVLSGLHISVNLVPTAALGGRYYYNPYINTGNQGIKMLSQPICILNLYTPSPEGPLLVRDCGEELFLPWL